MALSKKLLSLCLKTQIRIFCLNIASHLNIMKADIFNLKNLWISTELSLHPKMVQVILDTWF